MKHNVSSIKIFCTLFFSCCIITSCKKNSTNNVTLPVDSVHTNTPFLSGLFGAIKFAHDTSGNPAEYASISIVDSVQKKSIPAGGVTINGRELYFPYQPSYNYAYKFDTGVHWVISPAANVPAIEYRSQGGFPINKGLSPDTINRTTGVQLNITPANTNNSDSFLIVLDDRISGNMNDLVVVKHAVGQPAQITPSLIDSISKLFPVIKYPRLMNVQVQVTKYDYRIVDGKTYRFERDYTLDKTVYIR